jgi:hypothetical protein
MPYVACPTCGLRSYTAATWAPADHCPRCGCDLPARVTTLVPVGGPSQQLRWAAQIESARTALRHLRERPG